LWVGGEGEAWKSGGAVSLGTEGAGVRRDREAIPLGA